MENKKNMRNWLNDFELSHPLVIGGPCSAETEEQVLKIANQLKDSDVSVYRAGIWKPRTRPGMFEGVGAIGLNWLKKVKEQTGLLTATEVANKDHVKLAIENDIDILWIGARSTVSPFIMQELADALAGTEKIILVKNPVNPDLALWLGGVERLHSAKIRKLGLIHRGFSTYEKTKYRNNPEWQIAIEVKNRFPDLPMICDPSHISGRRDLIFDISQTALDLNFDRAWSSVSKALDNAEIVTNDRDRSRGLFFVSYAEEVDRRFFGLFGGRNSDQSRNDLKLSEEAQFEISITQENEKSIVRAVSKSGNIEESEKLLSKINESLS